MVDAVKNKVAMVAVIALFVSLLVLPTGHVFSADTILVHYQFEGNALDSSGNGNHGTVNGTVTYENGVIGQCARFYGDGGYIALPDNLIRNNPNFSVILRFKTTSKGILMAYQSAAVGSPSAWEFVPIMYVGTDGLLYTELYTSSGTINVASSIPVNDGVWHKVAMTASENSISVYLNDTKIGDAFGYVNHLSMSKNQIGTGKAQGRHATEGEWFPYNGLIDDFYFLSTGITDEEIQLLAPESPPENSISVVNNAGSQGNVTVTGLAPGDLVKVYENQTGGGVLASSTVEAGNTSATVDLTGLSPEGGVVYVSVTKVGGNESPRTEIAYGAATVTPPVYESYGYNTGVVWLFSMSLLFAAYWLIVQPKRVRS